MSRNVIRASGMERHHATNKPSDVS